MTCKFIFISQIDSLALSFLQREESSRSRLFRSDWLGVKLVHIPARDRVRFDHTSSSAQVLCERCKSLNLSVWLRTDSSIERGRDLNELDSDDLWVFRNLETVNYIVLRDDCDLCRCLLELIPYSRSLDQEVKLMLCWSMYRLKASMSVDTPEKEGRCQVRLRCARVEWYQFDDWVSNVEEGRWSGCYRIDFDGEGDPPSAKEIDPYCIDVKQIHRWLGICERLHPITCTLTISGKLRSICLIDVKERRTVRYSEQTRGYLALT